MSSASGGDIVPLCLPRIVSLLSSATEILFALGLDKHVVEVSHECNFPAEASCKPRATFTRLDTK